MLRFIRGSFLRGGRQGRKGESKASIDWDESDVLKFLVPCVGQRRWPPPREPLLLHLCGSLSPSSRAPLPQSRMADALAAAVQEQQRQPHRNSQKAETEIERERERGLKMKRARSMRGERGSGWERVMGVGPAAEALISICCCCASVLLLCCVLLLLLLVSRLPRLSSLGPQPLVPPLPRPPITSLATIAIMRRFTIPVLSLPP
ncbi:hypothetical protein Cni_G00203 [Canna indica]|uniref:Uncharacterized protein n=1 Tax=Canna indica TaxID=4628 RepID=A0AAQ3JKX0_9LILI|nr:hypothetical protein Cni_G00203 [Canna indica]